MVTLTYIDAYHVERTTTYTDLAACILAFSGCVTLPDTYNVTSIHYKGKRLPYTGKIDGLYNFLRRLNKTKEPKQLLQTENPLFVVTFFFW